MNENYVVTRNGVTCTQNHHIQTNVEQTVAKCRIEFGAKHRLCAGAKGTGERNDVHRFYTTIS